MTLDDLLLEVQHRPIILQPRGKRLTIWALPDVPTSTRRAIGHHKTELLDLLAASDPKVCPTRDLHRKYWKHVGQGRYECEVCQRIGV